MVVRPFLIAALFLTGSGCAHEHIKLDPAPGLDASRADRLAAFTALRPIGSGDAPPSADSTGVHLPQTPGRFSFSRNTNVPSRSWRPAPGDQHSPFLDLANGTRIRYAEDLLPVVPDSSLTAHHAYEEIADERVVRAAEYLGVVAGVMAITGFVIAFTVNRGNPKEPDAVMVPAISAAAVGLVVGAVSAVLAAWYGRDSVEARLSAFHSYGESLRTGLGLKPEDVETALTAYGQSP